MQDAAKLANKVAVVTGGASGLGYAVARKLAADGASVVITDISASRGRDAELESGFVFFEHDVRDETHWAAVIERVVERFGRIDILINNAGILGPKDASSPENTRLADWKEIFEINVNGVFLGCRAAIPVMRRSGSGAITNIASVAGLLASPYATAYGASKAAVCQLSKSIAQHCAPFKIRCNAVHPGNVRTALWERSALEISQWRQVSVEKVFEDGRAMQPMGELIEPEDVAAAVAFLSSDEARFVTGIDFVVDGGVVNCSTFHLMKASSGT